MEYHVHNNSDVAHKDVKKFCNTNQFPSLPFGGPHTKPHGVKGFINHHHMKFYPEMVHDIIVIRRIPWTYYEYTYML